MNNIFSRECIPILMLVVIYSSVFAQSFPTDKGSKILIGSFDFCTRWGDLYEEGYCNWSTLIEFTPSISYFIIPHVALGGRLKLERRSYEEFTLCDWSLGPQVMFFIGGNRDRTTVKGATYQYISAAFLLNRIVYGFEDHEDESGTGAIVSLGGGICHMLTNTVGLVGEADYEMCNLKFEDEESEAGSKFIIVAGFVIFLY